VGLDANYSELIDKEAIFGQVLEYLDDGVAFWTKAGVHHPFLLPGYKGAGEYYHLTFAQIRFRPEDASKVSFIELVDVPTFDQSELTTDDLNASHLQRINDAIQGGTAKYVFVPDRVGKLMKSSGLFSWMPSAPRSDGGALKIWSRDDARTVYWHYHLSVWGKSLQEKRDQLAAIRALVEVEERTGIEAT
jgi:hypothetical protein